MQILATRANLNINSTISLIGNDTFLYFDQPQNINLNYQI